MKEEFHSKQPGKDLQNGIIWNISSIPGAYDVVLTGSNSIMKAVPSISEDILHLRDPISVGFIDSNKQKPSILGAHGGSISSDYQPINPDYENPGPDYPSPPVPPGISNQDEPTALPYYFYMEIWRITASYFNTQTGFWDRYVDSIHMIFGFDSRWCRPISNATWEYRTGYRLYEATSGIEFHYNPPHYYTCQKRYLTPSQVGLWKDFFGNYAAWIDEILPGIAWSSDPYDDSDWVNTNTDVWNYWSDFLRLF